MTECGVAEIRNPKAEGRTLSTEARWARAEGERHFLRSDFGVRASFGLRPSGFGFASLAPELRYGANPERAGGSARRLSTRNDTLLRETVQIVLAAMAVACSASQPVKFQAAKVWR